MSKPVVFAFPADVELKPAPIAPHWVIEGQAEARAATLAITADGTSSVMAWSCNAGRFTWNYSFDETLHIISGEAFVTDEKGEVRRIGAGDVVFFPAGSRSNWYIPHEIRKIAFCRQQMPKVLGFALKSFYKLIDLMTGFSDMEADRGQSLPQPQAQPALRPGRISAA